MEGVGFQLTIESGEDCSSIREAAKYYFADFVRRGGRGKRGTLKSVTLFFGPKSVGF